LVEDVVDVVEDIMDGDHHHSNHHNNGGYHNSDFCENLDEASDDYVMKREFIADGHCKSLTFIMKWSD